MLNVFVGISFKFYDSTEYFHEPTFPIFQCTTYIYTIHIKYMFLHMSIIDFVEKLVLFYEFNVHSLKNIAVILSRLCMYPISPVINLIFIHSILHYPLRSFTHLSIKNETFLNIVKTQAQEYSHDGSSACMTPHTSSGSGYAERVKTCRSIKLRDCNTSVRRGHYVGNNSEYAFGPRRLFIFT